MFARHVFAAAALAGAPALATNAAGAPRLVQVDQGFSQPLAFVTSPDGRKFVVQQGGQVVELLGDLSHRTFLTVPNIVVGGEKGLLNVAFAPDFATSRRFYIYCTAGDSKGKLRVEIRRYTATADLSAGDPTSGKLLLNYYKPFENHNGGFMAFGPDGYLYLGTGDGGSANDPFNNGQSPSKLLGKILRIDVSGAAYTIPPTNPFVGNSKARPEVFAYGVRNPFRESFDTATGDLYIGDVGQDSREEIDVIKAGTSGQNFGWRVREGKIANPNYPNTVKKPIYVDPIYDYAHGGNTAAGQGNSVTGGYVYHGPVTALQGKYIFGDFIDAGLWSINTDGSGFTDLTPLLSTFSGVNISSFGTDAAANLYIVDYSGGRLFEFVSN